MSRFALKASVALSALALATFAQIASAQSAGIAATATVLTPLTVTGTQALNFGNVFPGLNKSVATTDNANAGKFTIAGNATSEVSVTFTLPTNLVSAGNNLPIGTWTGGYNVTNSAATATAFTPGGAALVQRLGTGAQGSSLFVFVGATVSPTSTQAAGNYSGTVTMNVVYTGN